MARKVFLRRAGLALSLGGKKVGGTEGSAGSAGLPSPSLLYR